MITRRTFIQTCSAGAVCGGSAAALAASTPAGAPNSAAIVGHWYLERYPSERDRQALVDHLRARIGTTGKTPESARPDDTPLWSSNAVQAAVADDYSSGNTLWLDGWLFSRTELRLCALATLT